MPSTLTYIVAELTYGLLSLFSNTMRTSKSITNRQVSKQLLQSGEKHFDKEQFGADPWEYAIDLAVIALELNEIEPTEELLYALAKCIEYLVISNAIFPSHQDFEAIDHDGEEGYHFRKHLERHNRFHANHILNNKRFLSGLEAMLSPLLQSLPTIPMSRSGSSGFGITMGDLLADPAHIIENIMAISNHSDLRDARLFEDLQIQFDKNVCVQSGIDYDNQPSNPYSYRLPSEYTGNRDNLIDGYLRSTPFKFLLGTPLPFAIPKSVRFEHTHIVGGTGHGKTQLLSHLIMQDLEEIQTGRKKSVVVIDSQGDFISQLSSLGIFDPTNKNSLADKLVMIDPRDVDYPIALNIFALNSERLERYGQVEREQVFNGAIELYEHFFKSLLGAELTAKQGVAFTYMARIMLELPNATIFTLRDLMDNPHAFKSQLQHLSGSTRMFFERELLSKAYNQTRRQISQRLWGILAIPAFERIFGQTEHKLDVFELLNEGKIILINTSKSLLKNEGSAIFGKFFIAAIAQAINERSELPEDKRTETAIYLDEAHEYADQSLDILLTQGRKYRAGITIAHQFLGQLPHQTKQSLLANASTKIVGGLQHADNQVLAKEMNTTSDFLQSMQKLRSGTVFGLWIKHTIPQAIKLQVPFGRLAGERQMREQGVSLLLEQNRSRYCIEMKSGEQTQITDKPINAEPDNHETQISATIEGRGGFQHKELQQMMKAIGHQYGFGVQTEAQCENSEGAIDVLLLGEKTTIAAEISISTSPAHELKNLQKCLNEQNDQILCISPDDQHRLAIQNLCIEHLPQAHFKRLTFLHPKNLEEYIKQFDERETTLIRGYEVITQTIQSDQQDIEYRRNRIKRVVSGL